MIPTRSPCETLLERNLSLMCSLPRPHIKQKNIQPHKQPREKLIVHQDTKWINEYLNFQKKKSKAKNTIDISPKHQQQEKKKPLVRPLSSLKRKALLGNDPQKNNQYNQENINLAANGHQISSGEEAETGRFGILSKKSVVRGIDYNQIIQHEKKIKLLQNHARRLSCQLTRSPDQQNKEELEENLGISEDLQFQRGFEQSKNIKRQKKNYLKVRLQKKVFQRMKSRRLSQQISKQREKIEQKVRQIEPQPWDFKRSLLQDTKQDEEELEKYVIDQF